jgi:hypothetical protein
MTEDFDPALERATEADIDAEVETFWNLARFHAKLNPVPGYFGPTALESVQPPAWSLGDTPDQADEALAGLLDGSRTSNSAPVADYEHTGQPLPEVGALGIVLDGAGHPRALVVTTDVRVIEGEVVEQLAVVYHS